MKRFRTWLLKQKAEVGQMIFPSAIDESMLAERTYRLRNGTELQIEIGNPFDVEDIIEVQKDCYDGKSPWGRLIVHSELKNPYSFFLLATDMGVTVAFIGISIKKERMHITNIATRPAYQKQGLASFFIQTVADIGRQMGQEKITLEVRVSNEGAIRLYRKIGFEDVCIKKGYYQDNNEDALEMHYQI